MTILQNAYRRILHYCQDFAKVKRAKKPNDVFKIIRFEQDREKVIHHGDGIFTKEPNTPEIIPIKDTAHIDKMLKDPNIIKLYYSTAMIEKFKYLAFIQLGIQYLREHAEFEGAQIGDLLLVQQIAKEKNKCYGDEPSPIP